MALQKQSIKFKLIMPYLLLIVSVLSFSTFIYYQLNIIGRYSISEIKKIEDNRQLLERLMHDTLLLREETKAALSNPSEYSEKVIAQRVLSLKSVISNLGEQADISSIRLNKFQDNLTQYIIKNNNLNEKSKIINQDKTNDIISSFNQILTMVTGLENRLFERGNFESARSFFHAHQVFLELNSSFMLYAELSENMYYKDFSRRVNFLKKILSNIDELELTSTEQAAFYNFKNSLGLFINSAQLLRKNIQKEVRLEKDIFNVIFPDSYVIVKELLEENDKNLEVSYERSNEKLISFYEYLIVGTLILLLLILYFIVTIALKIANPLQQLVNVMIDLSDGHLDKIKQDDNKHLTKLLCRRDELGSIAQSSLRVVNYQQRMVLDIDAACDQLASGQLTESVNGEFIGDFSQVHTSINSGRVKLMSVVENIVTTCNHLVDGELQVGAQVSLYQGDFQPIGKSINKLMHNLRVQVDDIVSVTSSMVQSDDLNNRFLLPKAEYSGDFLQIRKCLDSVVIDLKQSAEEDSGQNWLKSGLTEMNQQLTGEQPLDVLAKHSVDFITRYLNASIGYMYRSIEDVEIGKALKLIAHYGVLMDEQTQRSRYQFVYPKGIGLIGQVFYNPEIFVKALALDEQFQVQQSGIAIVKPSFVVILPLLHEGRVEGVLELGLNRNLTAIEQDFLTQVMPNLGIAMSVAVARDRMNHLLEQSQRQAEELEVQQVQLAQSNEMLQFKASELEEKQLAVEQKNAQLQHAGLLMEERASELTLASKYKSEFLANMSHELRSPLNSLLILAKLLLDNKNGHLDTVETGYAEVIHRSGTDLLRLIEDILDLSKIEAGKTDIEYHEVLLTDIIHRLKQRYKPIAMQKDLGFSLKIDTDVTGIQADETRLVQILTNLLSNAFKFTHQGDVALFIYEVARGERLSTQERLPFDALCYQVNDTGIGIDKENIERIFQAFQQADGTTNRQYGGTGLGLSITSHLVKLMGGYICLESEIDKGSEIKVYLPLIRHSESFDTDTNEESREGDLYFSEVLSSVNSAAKEEAPWQQQGLEALSNQLLIIENDQDLIQLFSELARQKGFQVIIGIDIGQGLQLAEKLQPKAIILNETLPQAQGKMVLERLKGNLKTRHIPVHVISQAHLSTRARVLGAIESGSLPLDNTQLERVLDNVAKFHHRENSELLVFSERDDFQGAFEHVLAKTNVAVQVLKQEDDAYALCEQQGFDCIVVDFCDDAKISFIVRVIERFRENPIPIVAYSDVALSSDQHYFIESQSNHYPLVVVQNDDSLLIELNLFLHQLENELSISQRDSLYQYFDHSNILSGKQVLIVDDNMSNVFSLSAVLEQNAVNCLIANDGRTALDMVRENPHIDLILMDIMMPTMDGYTTMKNIRGMVSCADTPIIALTAKAMPEDRNKCILAGANDYLTKPIESEKLISLMKIWLVKTPKIKGSNSIF